MQAVSPNARSEQAQNPPICKGDRVRNSCATRVGTAVKIYPDGSAAVCWDDADPQQEGLAHERVPRPLLEVLKSAAPSSDPVVHTVASILDFDHFQSEQPNDTGSVVLRRAANAISTIARLVSNSVRAEGNEEPVALSVNAQAGLLDALELIAHGMQFEADFADKHDQWLNGHSSEK